MDKAAVFTKGDVLHVVEAVLDLPVATFQFEQSMRIGDARRQACDAVVDLLLGFAALVPGSLVAKHLR